MLETYDITDYKRILETDDITDYPHLFPHSHLILFVSHWGVYINRDTFGKIWEKLEKDLTCISKQIHFPKRSYI